MITYDGYDAHSPTLRPSPAFGDCMGADWQNVLLWIDSGAKIFSGDYVQLGIRYQDGAEVRIIKQLLATRDGRWWIRCNDGVAPLGGLIQPFSIAKVVGREPYECATPHAVLQKADESTTAYYAMLSEDAVREWREQGELRVEFPGLAAVNHGGAP
jgi:hypothetical protein